MSALLAMPSPFLILLFQGTAVWFGFGFGVLKFWFATLFCWMIEALECQLAPI
jgi:hypothetical protein